MILSAAFLIPAAIVARAEVYLSEDQAAHVIFPELATKRKEFVLTEEMIKKIETASGQTVRSKTLTAYVGAGKEAVFIDRVLGKHEFITIAVGIDGAGKVRGVEILEYKETYGYQVRNAEWRKQFLGKGSSAKMVIGSDIQNISGATLSSVHVTAGVRRLVHTYEALKSTL